MSDIFKSKDLPQAAYLFCQTNVRFLGLEPRDQFSYLFCFASAELCEQAILNYLSGEKVRARDYADAIRQCKDLVFAKERERS